MTTANERPGIITTQFWGKLLMQVAVLANQMFDLDIQLDDATAFTIVGGLEAMYQLWRRSVRVRSEKATGRIL